MFHLPLAAALLIAVGVTGCLYADDLTAAGYDGWIVGVAGYVAIVTGFAFGTIAFLTYVLPRS